MRIFVYEYICGGGLAGQPLPESLRREGWAMLRAVLEDFGRSPGVEVVTLLDSRFAEAVAELEATRVDVVKPRMEARLFKKRTREADFTLVIAPESNFLLYQRCCWTENEGGRLLGPCSSAVNLTGDKVWLGEWWVRNGIPTPSVSIFRLPAVCKPRRGAGSQGMFLAKSIDELVAYAPWFLSDGVIGPPLVQTYIHGLSVSVSILIGGGWRLALPAATQQLSGDGRFRYLGGSLPLSDDLNDRAQRLALRAIAPIEGLSGYVGVDLILGDAADGSDDVAIEINPRLTTSYVGLRALAEFNLAETMLALALGRSLPERKYRAGIVRFLADGTVEGPEVQ